MKATLQFIGDKSVGINPATITVDGLPDISRNVDHREEMRNTLRECFADIMDEQPDLWFDDECPDCKGKIGFGAGFPRERERETGHRPSCPSRLKD